jgi:hypothetical protein
MSWKNVLVSDIEDIVALSDNKKLFIGFWNILASLTGTTIA